MVTGVRDALLLALAAAALLAASVILLATPALPHEWYTGQRDEAGRSCCGGYDCGPVPYDAVRYLGGTSWEITIAPGAHPMVRSEAITCPPPTGGHYTPCTPRPGYSAPLVLRYEGNPGLSPDGQAHVCIVAGKVRCLFIGGTM